MEATAAMNNHSRTRAPALRQAARTASVVAMTDAEIRAVLTKVAPPANTVMDAIQEAVEAAVGTEVEVADSEIALVFQVEAVDQAGHSLSLAWKCGRKATHQKHQILH